MDDFIAFLLTHDVSSYLEIGCKFGGSLWKIATKLPIGSKIVAVDLPGGDKSFKDSLPALQACVNTLKEMNYDVHLFIGDSTDQMIVEQVRALSPFDACLIDASHYETYVRKDWKNYGPMAKLVAFHDINFYRLGVPKPGKVVEVPKVWNEIKKGRKYHEIKKCPHDNGFGIIFNG